MKFSNIFWDEVQIDNWKKEEGYVQKENGDSVFNSQLVAKNCYYKWKINMLMFCPMFIKLTI